MNRYLLAVFVLVWFMSLMLMASAEGVGFLLYSQIRKSYLQEYESKGIPVLVARCALPHGMALLIQPIGERHGKFIEIYWTRGNRSNPDILNAGDITIGIEETLTEMLHGGLGTWRILNALTQRMSKLPFQLFPPIEFDRIVQLHPTKKCDVRDPG